MAFRIYGFDLDNNPNTNSWMGLSRDKAKLIADTLIWVGIWLSVSLFFPDPSDILIVWASEWLKTNFNISLDVAYILWHTLIAWGFVLIGIWIYPYNSHSLFNGYVNKAKNGMKALLKKPVKLILGLLGAYLLFIWIKNNFGLV